MAPPQRNYTVLIVVFILLILILMIIVLSKYLRKNKKQLPKNTYNETEFWKKFIPDLRNANNEVIIFSPYISNKRTETLLDEFMSLLSRNVKLLIYFRPENKLKPDEKELLINLKYKGALIFMRRKFHYKFVIIDRKLTWEGSMNILQHINSEERMTRHDDIEYTKKQIVCQEKLTTRQRKALLTGPGNQQKEKTLDRHSHSFTFCFSP